MNADSIKIECEEDGFWAVVDLETDPSDWPHIMAVVQTGQLRFRIADPEALYNTVKAEIGPWLYERDAAFRESFGYAANDPRHAEGYAADDPKHPDFHSVHADLWDSREGK